AATPGMRRGVNDRSGARQERRRGEEICHPPGDLLRACLHRDARASGRGCRGDGASPRRGAPGAHPGRLRYLVAPRERPTDRGRARRGARRSVLVHRAGRAVDQPAVALRPRGVRDVARGGTGRADPPRRRALHRCLRHPLRARTATAPGLGRGGARRARRAGRGDGRAVAGLAAATAGAIAAEAATPFGLAGALFPLRLLGVLRGAEVTSAPIIEHRAPALAELSPPVALGLVALLALAALAALVSWRRWRIAHLLIAAAFTA